MPVKDLKEELVSFIENTNDEELLSLLKEDFLFYGKVQDYDITDQLNSEQLQELKDLSNEDDLKETQTVGEFVNETNKWRTK